MNIVIKNGSNRPIYDQIIMQIKGAIMKGELKKGDSLPSMRALAKELKISVITTKRAYDDLEREGYIESVVGKGSFIGDKSFDNLEEHIKQIEKYLYNAVENAKKNNIDLKQLIEILEMIYEKEE